MVWRASSLAPRLMASAKIAKLSDPKIISTATKPLSRVEW